MASSERLEEAYEEKQHQAAYIFDPSADIDEPARPAKRRRVLKTADQPAHVTTKHGSFQRLLQGAESDQSLNLRQEVFETLWSVVDSRIQSILQDTNQSTLHQVTSFLRSAPDHTPKDKIASAFIITGPNIASQDLLFEQLSGALEREADAHVVRLRSGDASNLRAVLRKIIHDIVSKGSIDGDDVDLTTSKDGRKFLNYDLEALHAHLKLSPQRKLVVIAFQDSEAFDSGLLSDLISLLSSWLDRIPFAFLFGVATSVELFETRLLKSTCQCLYGDQFDVEQAASIVDKIFRTAVAHADVPVLIGPSLVGSFLERQREQVASIQDFIRSLKYTYMCHFYSNPLSFLLPGGQNSDALRSEHVEMLRCLPSFRRTIETAIENNDYAQAKRLLQDDSKLTEHLVGCLQERRQWVTRLLRILKSFAVSKIGSLDFASLYLEASYNGFHLSGQFEQFLEAVKHMEPRDSEEYLNRLIDLIQHGDQSLGLDPWADEAPENIAELLNIHASIKQLRTKAGGEGHVLRSQYSGQSKIVRTTVVAQKVQLSHDTAALTDLDKSYTDLIHSFLEQLETTMSIGGACDMPFHEVWFYDSKTPYRDVFIPRPRNVFERALSRPHDYLGCTCCKEGKSHDSHIVPTTAILYQMYLETGTLINVGDLWSAYHATMGEDVEEAGLDERSALVLFYRSMAELKAMGFVKQSRKKADHIAKVAWKGL